MVNIHNYSYEKNEHLFGPGRRLLLFCQGCSIHCAGCINQHLWKFGVGNNMTTGEILQLLVDVDGITLHGGEPLDQATGIFDLIKAVKSIGKNVILFTGYKKKELIQKAQVKAWNMADIVISGRYDSGKRNINLQFRGSTNQRVYTHPGILKDYTVQDGKSIAIFRINENGKVEGRGFRNRELQELVNELKTTVNKG